MQYSRCKCGKMEHWGSGMMPRICTPCKECGSIPAQGPNSHPEPVPHEFFGEEVETDAGLAVLSRCKYCLKTKKQLGMS